VPSFSINEGMKYKHHNTDWGMHQAEEYTNKHYHQPSDEYDPSMDFTGADLPPDQAREQRKKLLHLAIDIKKALRDRKDIFSDQVIAKQMLAMSKCPDYVINKGHYFGTSFQTEETPLSDDDKRALIGFLKTL